MIKTRELDVATRIFNLSLEIKHLVEEYQVNKYVVIEDFSDLMMAEFVEGEDEKD